MCHEPFVISVCINNLLFLSYVLIGYREGEVRVKRERRKIFLVCKKREYSENLNVN